MSESNIILVGYSGHGFVVADAAFESHMPLRFYADQKQVSINPYNLEYIGSEHDPDFSGWKGSFQYILGIGDNIIRQKVAARIIEKNQTILNVIHPLTSISKSVKMGVGNFVSKHTSINPLAVIGDFCILNTSSVIEHECILSNAVHVAPGAVLAGNVLVGENTFIGANAVIKQGIKIGKHVVIGAGSVVIKDIEDNAVYVGNPARKIK
ncbi:MAG: acetyltransferase [Bacteroidetes bacterium]|nr:acetyltransferase [Bacteroidota bacterium]